MKDKTCFFSHNWSDSKDEFKRMLKEKIKRVSNSEIRVIYDRDDFVVSDNLSEKEKIILEATTVVLFLSPAYKRAVEKRAINKGSYREYENLIKRLSYDKSCFLFPILVSGNLDTAVPEELRNIIYQDATKTNVIYDEDLNLFNTTDENAVERLAQTIVNTTNLLYNLNSEKFSNSIEKTNELIHNTHSKNTLPSQCMISTDAYTQITNQASFVFSGRKGSGKTTLIELIEKYDYKWFYNTYKHLHPISFEKMNVESLYDNFTQICKRNRSLFRATDFIKIFWEVFLVFSSMIIICKEYDCGRILDKTQKTDVIQISEKIKSAIKIENFNDISTETIFTLTNDAIKKQYDTLYHRNIDSTNLDSILVANLNPINIIKNTVGASIFDLFENVIKRCQKKIMLFMDGFNSDSETFKRISKSLPQSDYKEKIRRDIFETDLYKGLINVVTEIKESEKAGVLKNMHFCIVLPEDRIEQIRITDRDFIKRKISSLRWDGILLIKMINKRLLAIKNLDELDDDPFYSFEKYMQKYYPKIPTYYKFKINNSEIAIDIFTYFLSLSFWRPRDILTHLSFLITAIQDDNFEMSDKTLRVLLYSSSEKIITDEFYKEYENVIFNLDEIVGAFKNKNIVLTPSDCYKAINNITFQLIAEKKYDAFESKMRFLYEIGFIGVVLPESIKEQYEYETEFCFIFNEGIKPFEFINFESDLRNFKFVINHLFYNHLNLNYNSDCFIENYSKEYLISNHQLRNLRTNY